MTCRGIPGITCYPCEGGANVPGLFLAGSFGKQGIAAENAGQTRVAAAEGETDGEFWRFNQQRMLVPHILKKLPKNEKNSCTVHQCTVHNRSRENQEKASEWLNDRET